MNKKILIYFTIFIIAISGFSFAEETETTEFISPKLPKDVEAYNSEQPENLNPDQLYAKSAILIEAETGLVVYEKNADEIMFPASTTKILTALIGLERGNMDDIITITEDDMNIPADSSTIPMQAGETIQLRDLIYATMLRSGNEGANAIARAVSGNVNDFVTLMNQVANNIGCTNTNFQNAHGLHDPNHYTTVRDMAKIAREAMKNPEFKQIATSSSYTLPKSNIQKKRKLFSRISDFIVKNEKNEFFYMYGNGIKTGFTNYAGHCFVGSAESLGVNLISVVFYSSVNGRWYDTIKLMDYGFSQVVSETPISLFELDPMVIETSGYSTSDANLGKLELRMQATGEEDMRLITTVDNVKDLKRSLFNNSLIEYKRDFRAPIQKDELMGVITCISPQTGQSATYNLMANRSIDERTNLPPTLSQIVEKTLADTNIFPKITLELFVLWLIPPVALYILSGLLIKLFKRRKRKNINKKMPRNNTRRYR